MSKISVIIAAYNVEKYIEETVNSVLRQTMNDVEIVAVDDCSTDSTLQIIERLAQQDARIKIVRHSVNQSAMLARKSGFEHSTGDYLMFLDGDDLLSPDACKIAYEESLAKGTDLLQFGVLIYNEKGFLEERDPDAFGMYQYLQYVEKRFTATEEGGLLSKEKKHGDFNYNFVTKVYRRDLAAKVFANLPEEHLNIAEDLLLSYLALYFATAYDVVDKKLYLYQYGVGITGNTRSDAKIKALAGSWYVYKYLENWTAARGKEKSCRYALDRIKRQMMDNVADTLLSKASPEQYALFLDEFMKPGTEEELILSLAYRIYARKAVKPDRAAQVVSQLRSFRSSKQKAKTIGTYYFRMYNGGIENVMSLVTDLWVKSGYDVVLFTDCEPNKNDYPLNPAIKRMVLPPITEPTAEQLEARIVTFRRELLAHDIDLMVYHAWINPYLVLDEMIVKSCNAKLLLHTHGLFCSDVASYDLQATYNNLTIGNSYALTDMVVALTDVDLAWWRNYGLRAEKVINPVKLSFDSAPSPLTGHNIICSGRVDSYQKQTLQAVQIAELVKKKIPDVTLTLLGGCDDADYQKIIENYIEDHHLEDTVTLAGFTQDVLPYYQKSDLMLSTSRFEGFGLVYIESKICGLPLVAYYLPNLDIARAPKGMINVPQDDINAAANVIIEIFRDDALKKRLGAEARESACELYGEDLAERWKFIFEETMTEREEPQGIRVAPPMEAAVHLLVDFLGEGMLKRGIPAIPTVTGGNEWLYYAEQCKVLSNALREIGESESYRLGLFLTAIPRKLRSFFKRRKENK